MLTVAAPVPATLSSSMPSSTSAGGFDGAGGGVSGGGWDSGGGAGARGTKAGLARVVLALGEAVFFGSYRIYSKIN